MKGSKHETGIGSRVCVVGTGGLGLVAMKNLMEQGLHVQAFEQNSYVGGIWHVSSDPTQTSAFTTTRAQYSRQSSCYTDFPMSKEYSTYPSAMEYEQYLESYAEHFRLVQHIQFYTRVTKIKRTTDDKAWLVFTRDTRTRKDNIREFDRIVLATGINTIKHQPSVEGIEKFTGDVIHSQQLKDAKNYSGQNVLVVGAGPTAADVLQLLAENNLGKLYISHRGGVTFVPRLFHGRPLDHYFTTRIVTFLRTIASWSPAVACALSRRIAQKVQKEYFPFLASKMPLSATQNSSSSSCIPTRLIISDRLPYLLRDDVIEVVPKLERVTGPKSVICGEGSIDSIDIIIFCTGYQQDFSIIDGAGNPTDVAFAPDKFKAFNNAKFRRANELYPRLYYGLLSERYPDSLAILGHVITFHGSTFVQYDLATMALASLWSSNYPLPSKEVMKNEIDRHYRYVVRELQNGPMRYIGYRFNYRELHSWMNTVAGTGVEERLHGWGWTAWGFWWKNRKLYKLLANSIMTPAIYRLFNTRGGRVYWKGAESCIKATQEEVTAMAEAWKRSAKVDTASK